MFKGNKDTERFRGWTQQMYQRLQDELGQVLLNGHPTERLAHNLNVSLPGIESKALMVKLKGVVL